MMRLVNLYGDSGTRPGAARFLYELMKEREPEMNISHRGLPRWDEHVAFIRRRPYRFWYLIEVDGAWAGYISATADNEIGVVIRKAYRGQGLGPKAIKALITLHYPNPGVPSERNNRWLANINPENEHSKHVFQKLGFRKLQETFILEEDHGKTETEGPARQLDAGQGAGDSADALGST